MEARIFWDVDTQRDFIEPGGALYIPGAEKIVGNLERLTCYARENRIRMIGSVDHHTLADAEIAPEPDFERTFPPHCLRDSAGYEKIEATAARDPLWIDSEPLPADEVAGAAIRHSGELIFRKQAFDVFSNGNVDAVLAALDPAEIVLYGVALDVCDAYAIEGLLERGRRVVLVEDAVWPIDPVRGAAMVERWRERGVRVVKTEDVLAGKLGATAASGR